MIKPLNKKVLVKILEEKNENSFGLIVEKKTDVVTAKVISTDASLVKVNDVVLISKVNIAETPYGHLVDEKDILAIVD